MVNQKEPFSFFKERFPDAINEAGISNREPGFGCSVNRGLHPPVPIGRSKASGWLPIFRPARLRHSRQTKLVGLAGGSYGAKNSGCWLQTRNPEPETNKLISPA